VAIAMRNYPEWIVSFWAAQFVGAVTVPINAWLTGAEIARLLSDCEPKVLIADGERIDRLQQVEARLPDVVVSVRATGAHDTAIAWKDFVPSEPEDLKPALRESADIAMIAYTSGTTGIPKGVLATQRNLLSAIVNMRLRVAARSLASGDPDERGNLPEAPQATALIVVPLFHISGLSQTIAHLYAGRHVVLTYRWNLHTAAELIKRYRVEELSGPPLIISEIVGAAAGDHGPALSSLKALSVGGSATPPELVDRIYATFDGRLGGGTGYGSTETTGPITLISAEEFKARTDSAGMLLPTVEARIRKPDGTLGQPGEPGELEVFGPQVSPGYRSAADTGQCFTDGWFSTGDLATLDAEGYLRIVGRVKDIVIRGGENVYPAEIEAVLTTHPHVVEAAVYGVAEPRYGEVPHAVVRCDDPGLVDPEELRAVVADRLAAFKVPARIVVVTDPLPRNATGKVIKYQLAEFVRSRSGSDDQEGSPWT
jgi:long-chain acyl-CoA synthetase